MRLSEAVELLRIVQVRMSDLPSGAGLIWASARMPVGASWRGDSEARFGHEILVDAPIVSTCACEARAEKVEGFWSEPPAESSSRPATCGSACRASPRAGWLRWTRVPL